MRLVPPCFNLFILSSNCMDNIRFVAPQAKTFQGSNTTVFFGLMIYVNCQYITTQKYYKTKCQQWCCVEQTWGRSLNRWPWTSPCSCARLGNPSGNPHTTPEEKVVEFQIHIFCGGSRYWSSFEWSLHPVHVYTCILTNIPWLLTLQIQSSASGPYRKGGGWIKKSHLFIFLFIIGCVFV